MHSQNFLFRRLQGWRLFRAGSTFAGLLILGLLVVLFYGFTQPLHAQPLLLPFGIVSRSQAEREALGGGGRFLFQGQPTVSSYLTTYDEFLRHAPARVPAPASTLALVWVVTVRGKATFLSPVPGAGRPPPTHMVTFTTVTNIFGGTPDFAFGG